MPRTDPPPTKKADALGGARYASSPPGEDIDLETEIMLGDDEIGIGSSEEARPEAESGDVEITTGEADIALEDLDFDDGDDPRPSPYERITVAPEVPESEYVARMMREAPPSDPVTSARPMTPPSDASEVHVSEAPATEKRPSGTVSSTSGAFESMSLDSISSWPAPDDLGELTLDLADSVPPPGETSSAPPSPSIPPPPSLPDTSATGVRQRPPELLEPDIRVRESEPADDATDTRTPAGDIEPEEGIQHDAPQASGPPIERPLSFGPASGDALELVQVRAQSVKPGPPRITMRAVRDRFDVGDFSGALILAEGILDHDPESVDALLYAEHCRDVLKQMYISRLGGVKRVPEVVVSDEQLRWLNLDHRAGFLLSLVDGHSSFEEVLDVSGMPPVEALRLLLELLQQNVIRVG